MITSNFEDTMQQQLAEFINSHESLLYPNTPIELRVEEGRSRMLFFALWCEGEWYHDCCTLQLAEDLIAYLIKHYASDWLHRPTRVNPSWSGWQHVSMTRLFELAYPDLVNE